MDEKRHERPRHQKDAGGPRNVLNIDISQSVTTKCQASDLTVYYKHGPKDDGDMVTWTSTDGHTYAIVFQQGPPSGVSPFDETVFIVSGDGNPTLARPITKKPSVGGDDYKYRIVGDNGCDIDPMIHVQP